ncbi:MAG TPA: DUF1918 domain-containing protein [Egibacteraceae bacterium]|nr:DUF1918 domain-containing protein [Egibacteraceae bacterium]
MDVKPGDVIEVSTPQVGSPMRRGKVLELVSQEPFELRVEWEDGHESTFYPSGGVIRLVDQG